MAPDGEERVEDAFLTANRAFAGWCQTFAFGKDEAAGAALGRGYHEQLPRGVDAAADMLQVPIDLLFRDVHSEGDIFGRERPIAQKCDYLVPDRVKGRAGNGRLAGFYFH